MQSWSPSGEITSTSSNVLRSDLRLGLPCHLGDCDPPSRQHRLMVERLLLLSRFLAVGSENRLDRSPHQILIHAILQGLLVHKKCLPDALYGPLDVIVRMRETDHE